MAAITPGRVALLEALAAGGGPQTITGSSASIILTSNAGTLSGSGDASITGSSTSILVNAASGSLAGTGDATIAGVTTSILVNANGGVLFNQDPNASVVSEEVPPRPFFFGLPRR